MRASHGKGRLRVGRATGRFRGVRRDEVTFETLGLGDVAGIITDAPLTDPTLDALVKAGVSLLPA